MSHVTRDVFRNLWRKFGIMGSGPIQELAERIQPVTTVDIALDELAEAEWDSRPVASSTPRVGVHFTSWDVPGAGLAAFTAKSSTPLSRGVYMVTFGAGNTEAGGITYRDIAGVTSPGGTFKGQQLVYGVANVSNGTMFQLTVPVVIETSGERFVIQNFDAGVGGRHFGYVVFRRCWSEERPQP